MAKYFGKVGYASTEETKPGRFVEVITERDYYGDIASIGRRLSNSEGINDNFTLNHEFSIVADPYAYDNFCNIRYISYGGVKWKVTSVEVQFPRLKLTIGGVYNGEDN